MQEISTSETSVNFYQTTQRNILEDSNRHTPQLKSYESLIIFFFQGYNFSC